MDAEHTLKQKLDEVERSLEVSKRSHDALAQELKVSTRAKLELEAKVMHLRGAQFDDPHSKEAVE